MDTTKKHGVLWIGFGNFAKHLYTRVVQRPNTEIVYFYYPEEEEATKRFGPKASWDIRRAIADPSVTTVFITTPNDRHTKYLKLALANRKHIFVEKPVTAFVSEVIELLPAMRRNEAVFIVGHNKRREAAIRKAKEMIDSGEIGRVVSIYANNSKGIAHSLNPTDWRFQIKRHREGPLITVGIHLIEAMHYLVGPINTVSAIIKNISQKTEAPDSSAALLNFRNGVSAFLEANYNTPSEDIFNIHGTDGTLYINRGRLYCRRGRDQNRVPSDAVTIPLESIDTIAEEINEFFDAIENNRQTIETGYQESLNALAVIEACFQSSLNQKWVRIKSITREYFKNKSAF